MELFKEHATILNLGRDVQAQEWKEASTKILKSTSAMHFSIKKCKRFFLKRNRQKTNILVRAEETYNNKQNVYKSICKKGKFASQIIPAPVPMYVKIKEAKIKDVKTLLTTHYGEEWEGQPELKYFKEVFARPAELQNVVEEEMCEMLEEASLLLI